jgi:hypothetical protein
MGNYATKDQLNSYALNSSLDSYALKSSLDSYALSANTVTCNPTDPNCKIPAANYTATCRAVTTPFSDAGGPSGQVINLDRHNLQCNKDEYLNQFHIARDPTGTQIQLQGTCCKLWNSM